MKMYSVTFRLNSFENLKPKEVKNKLREAFEVMNIYDEVNNEINDFEIEDEWEVDGE